jgi:hypothetical protein
MRKEMLVVSDTLQEYQTKLVSKYLPDITNPEITSMKIVFIDRNFILSKVCLLKKIQRTYFLKITYNMYFEKVIPINLQEKKELKKILPMLKNDAVMKKQLSEKFIKG